jgi:hypothetical protein
MLEKYELREERGNELRKFIYRFLRDKFYRSLS